MRKILGLVLFTLGLNGLHQITLAQVIITNLSTAYTQDFDSFGTNDVAWTDNVTLPGWYLTREGLATVVNVTADDGNGTLLVHYNYGTIADSDRALGSLAGSINSLFYGVRFINSGAFLITNISVSYDGEQWKIGNIGDAIPDQLQFFYRIDGTDFLADTNNVGWTAVSALNFNSPQNPSIAAQALNGNESTNRVAGITANIPLTLEPGQEIWLRWFDTVDEGGDNGLAIDNVSVQFQGVEILNASVELKKPKPGKKLTFKGSKGFPFQALIKTTNTVSSVSYFAFGGTNTPTNVVFKTAGKLTEFKKGKKLKQGYRYLAKHKGKDNKPGTGIAAGASPVTLTVRVQGSNGGTNNAQLSTNFVFSDVNVK